MKVSFKTFIILKLLPLETILELNSSVSVSGRESEKWLPCYGLVLEVAIFDLSHGPDDHCVTLFFWK